MTTQDRTEPGTDIIDLCDVTERVDELREARDDYDGGPASDERAAAWGMAYPDEAAELAALETLLDELRGYGGDHQWNGDWYPGSLIADEYFETYARELAEDIGAVPRDLGWPACHIDWAAAADALKEDYSQVDYGGVTYWYR